MHHGIVTSLGPQVVDLVEIGCSRNLYFVKHLHLLYFVKGMLVNRGVDRISYDMSSYCCDITVMTTQPCSSRKLYFVRSMLVLTIKLVITSERVRVFVKRMLVLTIALVITERLRGLADNPVHHSVWVPCTPLPISDPKSWVGYRKQFKHPCSSVTKTLDFTQADLVWLEPFLRFLPSLVGHFQTHILGH